MRSAQLRHLVVLAAIGLALFTACHARPKGRSLLLPSGNNITITGIGRIYISGDKSWALALKYVTQVPSTNQVALKAEATEVVNLWKTDLEKSGLHLAVLSALEPPKGFIITTSRGKNFLVKKEPTGAWELQ